MPAEPRPQDTGNGLGAILVPPDLERSPAQRFLRGRYERPLTSIASGPDVPEASLLGLATLCALLHRYSGDRDLAVGMLSPPLDGEQPQVVPLYLTVDPMSTVADLFPGVEQAVVASLAARAEYDPDALMEALGAGTSFDRDPLFQIAYGRVGAGGGHVRAGAELDEALETAVRCDLVFVHHLDGEPALRCDYDSELFTAETIARILDQWALLIDDAAERHTTPVVELNLMTVADDDLIARSSDGPVVARPDTTLDALVAGRAAAQPDAPAVTADGVTLTYAELDRLADRAATYLTGVGVAAGEVVALCLRRSRRVPVLALGVMKAGAAFLPLDPHDPDARLRDILVDAGARLVLCDDAAVTRRLADLPGTTAIDLDRAWTELGRAEPAASRTKAATDLAYVIYTSGSTGRPKGVLIEHAAVCNRLLHGEIRLSAGDSVLQKTPLTFDVAVWDLFFPLVHGARVVLTTPDGHRDSRYLVDTIRAEDITAVHFVPSMLRVWLAEPGVEECVSLRYVTASGEALAADIVDEFTRRLPGVALYNYYGPTEAAIEVTFWRADTGRTNSIPIGRPIENVRVLVLDNAGHPVPVGVPGELHIAGVCLARGYVDPADEAGRFATDPDTGERRYASGDRVRRRSDGALDYLGRFDQQLKLRGFRIEAGEVEAALRACAGVHEAVVVTRGADAQSLELVGHVTAEPARVVDPATVREALHTILPAYMVPTWITVSAELPRTTAGKIDRARLPDPATRPAPGRPGTTTSGPLAATIGDVWRGVLGRDEVSFTDNFFDLGGNSLLLARVHQALEGALSLSISRTDLFRYPTIATLAAALSGCGAATPDAPTQQEPGPPDGPFAIIGMACRMPGVSDLDEFWGVIADARTTMTKFGEAELLASGEPAERIAAPDYVPVGAVLDDIAGFDADYFGFTAREAQLTDPQHRLLLECSVQALEHAGYGGSHQRPRTGVFVGGLPSSYFHRYFASDFTELASTLHYQTKIGNEPDFLPTSIAYRLDLRGPAVTVQTACSTSLVAVHMACASISRGECEIALAGGVAIRVPDRVGYLYQEGAVSSPDGHCRAFDEQAAGTVFGNGAGVAVLKRLDDAVRDGDHIWAVVRGSAINNDGAAKVGFTAPSIEGQVEVIRRAHEQAGVRPDEIDYVEAHGTATPLGDPIEIAALTAAFGTERASHCTVGSVKANIGHLDTAAGIAGLIKATLALKHGVLPGIADLTEPSSRIPWETTPFRVTGLSRPWPADRTRVAAVSAFGIGGTNAHVVLEAAPPRPAAPRRAGWTGLFRLSARDEAALREGARRWVDFLTRWPETAIEDICYTASFGREHHAHRLAVVTGTVDELRTALQAYLREEPASALFTPSPAPAGGSICLVIGDGPAPGLTEFVEQNVDDPIVRAALHRCTEALPGASSRPLLPDRTPAERAFAAQYVQAELWRATGVAPSAVIGYGTGEPVAAALTGAIDLATAAALATADPTPGGTTGRLDAGATPADRKLWLASAGEGEHRSVEGAVQAASRQGVRRMLLLGRASEERARVRIAVAEAGGESLAASDGPLEFWRGHCVAVAKLYVDGDEVCLDPWGPFAAGHRIPLPTYPFQHSPHWTDRDRQTPAVAPRQATAFELPGQSIALPLSSEIRYESIFRVNAPAYVDDHRLFGTAVVPGASHIAMVLAAGVLHIDGPFALKDTVFLNPFAVSDGGSRRTQLMLSPTGAGWDATLVAQEETDDAQWTSMFRTVLAGTPTTEQPLSDTGRAEILSRCPDELPGHSFYRDVWVPGLDTGNSFQWIETIWRGQGEVLCLTARPPGLDVGAEPLHAGLVEAAFQVLNSCWRYDNEQLRATENIYVPFGIDRYHFSGQRTDGPLWIHAWLAGGHTAGDEAFTACIRMYSATGELVVAVDGFESRRINRGQVQRALARRRGDVAHEQHWQRADLAAGPQPDRIVAVVLSDERALLCRFADILRGAGIEPIPVLAVASDAAAPGDGDGDGVAEVDLRATGALGRILADLSACSSHAVVDLRGLAAEPAAGDPAYVRLGAERCAAATDPVPELAAAGVRLWWPTIGAQPVADDADVVNPSASMLWGVATVVRREFPELRCTTIDLLDGTDADLGRLAAEIRAWPDELRVAYRDHRYVARLRKAPPGTPTEIRGDRSYLVTGGLRGIGRQVGAWLATEGAGSLILIGRHHSDVEAAQAVAEIGARGVPVHVVRADVAGDSADLVAAVAAAPYPLGGIVHVAGVLDDATIGALDADRFERVLAPKVGGTLGLRRVVGANTEFVVLFSSLTAAVGAGGQANYAAANAYLDAFASMLRAEGTTATSIAWGPWAEIGMAARLGAGEQARSRDRGLHELEPEQGLRLLGENLAAGGATTIVANVDWPKLAAAASSVGDQWFGARATAAPTEPGAPLRGRVEAALRGERRALARELVASEVKVVLGLTAEHLLDPEQGFTELGMDSLAVVELRSRLQDGFGVSLSVTVGFDYPTVAAAADHVLAALEPETGAEPNPGGPETAAPGTAATVHTIVPPASGDDPVAAELAMLEEALRSEPEW